MLPYHALCRDSFHEGLSAPVVGHDVLSFRKDDYVRKATLACDLRRESIEKVQRHTASMRDRLSGFQRLQERINDMVRGNRLQGTQATRHNHCIEVSASLTDPDSKSL